MKDSALKDLIDSIESGVIDFKIEEIAQKHLSIDTLKTRNSDSLDFYERSVWRIKTALQQAYLAGFSLASEAVTKVVEANNKHK